MRRRSGDAVDLRTRHIAGSLAQQFAEKTSGLVLLVVDGKLYLAAATATGTHAKGVCTRAAAII